MVREWMEGFFAPGDRTPFLFRTSYPVQNIFVCIALKALMLLPAIFLAWFPAYMGVNLFLWAVRSARSGNPSGLGATVVTSVIIAGGITYFLLANFRHYLHLGFSTENYFERVTDTPSPNARCQILQAPMTEPVRLYRCGHLFERKALIEWIRLPGMQGLPGMLRRCPSCWERIWTKGECEAERSERERERGLQGDWRRRKP